MVTKHTNFSQIIKLIADKQHWDQIFEERYTHKIALEIQKMVIKA